MPLINLEEFKTDQMNSNNKDMIDFRFREVLKPIKQFYNNIGNIVDKNNNDVDDDMVIDQYLCDFKR